MKLETIALHHGYDSDKNDQKAASTPIYQTSGFTIDDTQHGADLFDLKVEGNIYSRIGNHTNDVLEKRVAENGGGYWGVVSCLWHGSNHLCHPVYRKGRR